VDVATTVVDAAGFKSPAHAFSPSNERPSPHGLYFRVSSRVLNSGQASDRA
jgi:hypothetical protein